ncbi:MAG: sugar phosphate isomerase/epimerase [candidate division KSB1 bacterium]|nr:sugar phosphate isomerase/epimerase [candidate division KSB1 bacterium]MDZ7313823.1 sugar phosphate isomerase/epimerase [candidate division KSB1 bacterium]
MQIYLSCWSVRSLLKSGELNFISLPKFARENGFEGIELFDRLFPSRAVDFLTQLESALQENHCGLVVAIGNDFTLADARAWQRQIDHVRGFLEITHFLGGRVARIFLGGQGFNIHKVMTWLGEHPLPGQRQSQNLLWQQRLANALLMNRMTVRLSEMMRKRKSIHDQPQPAMMERCVAALRQLLPTLDELDMRIGIENHWGLSTNPETVVEIIRGVGSPRIGTCPDFGNFAETQDRYAGLQILAPYARHVHAKSYCFNEAGEETTIDYSRCLRILRDAGYDGAISAEFEGAGDQRLGSQKTKDLILRHWK